MSRFSPSASEHWIRCRPRYDHTTGTYVPEWSCHSEWDVYYPGDRLRHPRHRVSYFHTLKEAQRWAKKYGVDCPTEMEPPREPRKL